MTQGNLFKNARIQKNMTQKELADLLHVSAQAVNKWENDKSFPGKEKYFELMEILGIPVEMMFYPDFDTFIELKLDDDFFTSPEIISYCKYVGMYPEALLVSKFVYINYLNVISWNPDYSVSEYFIDFILPFSLNHPELSEISFKLKGKELNIIDKNNNDKKEMIILKENENEYFDKNGKCLISDLKENQYTILSKNIKLPFNAKITPSTDNVLVIGGAGTGKSLSFIKPNIMQMNSSFIINDRSGIFFTEFAPMLLSNNYKIKVINLNNKNGLESNNSYSYNYNPFSYIKTYDDILDFVECFTANTRSDITDDKYYSQAERMFLICCIHYLINNNTNDFPVNIKGLKDICLLAKDKDYFIKLFKKHVKYELDEINIFDTQCNFNTWITIVNSCLQRLNTYFMSGEIEQLMSEDNLELEKIGDEKTALFIISHDFSKAFDILSPLVYTQIYNLQTKKHESNKENTYPIRFYMDEFANYGIIPKINYMLSVGRKLNISIIATLQCIEQVKELYPNTYQQIINNTENILFLGSSNYETLDFISNVIGKNNTLDALKNTPSYLKPNLTKNIIEPEELKLLNNKSCIVISNVIGVVIDEKYNGKGHPKYKELTEICMKDIFS